MRWASSAKIENPVTGSSGSYKPSTLEGKMMQEDVAVDEIESIALWRVGLPFQPKTAVSGPSSRRSRPIAIEMSLLQQVRAAGKIIDPRPGLFSPSLVAIEPEPVGSKRQAGRHVGSG